MPRAFISIEVQGRWLAIDAAQVEEVAGERPWQGFAEGRDQVVGAMPWRGGAIGVLDVGQLTGLAPSLPPGSTRRRNPIVKNDGLTAALPVDGVREAVEVGDDQVSRSEAGPFCAEVVALGEERLPVFDAAAAVKACRLARLT
jgi:chemotaxis signal transduction protein